MSCASRDNPADSRAGRASLAPPLFVFHTQHTQTNCTPTTPFHPPPTTHTPVRVHLAGRHGHLGEAGPAQGRAHVRSLLAGFGADAVKNVHLKGMREGVGGGARRGRG